MKYIAFISYKRVSPDKEAALHLHRALETYRLPRALIEEKGGSRIGRVFLDTEELSASASLSDTLKKALEQSSALIVLCSPSARTSQWVQAEIDYFIELGRADRILTVLVDGSPETSIPVSLSGTQGSSFEQHQPLAVDVRAPNPAQIKKRIDAEKLRLIAPLVECDYDQLRRRDEERQRRGLQIALVVSGLISVAILTLLMLTIQAKQAEEEQRRRAEGNLELALTTGNHILETVDIKLRRVPGAVAARRELLQTSLELLNKLKQESPEEEGAWLLSNVRARLQLGDTHLTNGKVEDAHGEYEAALAFAQRLQVLGKEVEPHLVHVATSYRKIGDSSLAQGELEQARRFYDQSTQLSESITQNTPADFDARLNLVIAYTRLGYLANTLGDLKQAGTYYQRWHNLANELHQQKPDHKGAERLFVMSYGYLGDSQAVLGEPAKARSTFKEGCAHGERLLKAQPEKDQLYRQDLAGCLEGQGRVELQLREFTASQQTFQRCLDTLQPVLERAESNTLFQHIASLCHRGLGEAYLGQAELELADQQCQRSAELALALSGKDKKNVEWLRGELISRSCLYKVHLSQEGAAAKAKAQLKACRAILSQFDAEEQFLHEPQVKAIKTHLDEQSR